MTDNNQLQPPTPHKRMSLGVKILLLGLQCGLLMLGAFVVFIMTDDRERYSDTVQEEIYKQWGPSLEIGQPMVLSNKHGMYVGYMSSSYECKAIVNSETVHRNSYEAEIYTAKVYIKANYTSDYYGWKGDDCLFQIQFNTREIMGSPVMKINGISQKIEISTDGLECKIPQSDYADGMTVETEFEIRGSQSLFFRLDRECDLIEMKGNAKNPSFQGEFLPNNRDVSNNHFYAVWKGKNIDNPIFDSYVGITFLVGVDRYQKVSRTLKYAFLIILLTYISVLFSEIVLKRNIPFLNYFLIGAALILFYSLLLSFVEHLSFGISYLIASVMTVVLISGYMCKMLSSHKVGLVMGAILTGLYVSCFILLSLSTYALLLGSLILFIALGTMMYVSLQLNR